MQANLSQWLSFSTVFDGWLVKYGATMAGYAVVALPVFGALSVSGTTTTSDRTRDYIRNTQILVRHLTIHSNYEL